MSAQPDAGSVGLSVCTGPSGKVQAERLLWRAGLGPRHGDAEAPSKLGHTGAVESSMRSSGPAQLVGLPG